MLFVEYCHSRMHILCFVTAGAAAMSSTRAAASAPPPRAPPAAAAARGARAESVDSLLSDDDYKDMDEQALPFITLHEDADTGAETFRVHPRAVEYISSLKGKIAVVAIAGMYRTGKSYLLNLLVNKPGGFRVAPTVKACTKGIWIWGKAVEVDGSATTASDQTILVWSATTGAIERRGSIAYAPGCIAWSPFRDTEVCVCVCVCVCVSVRVCQRELVWAHARSFDGGGGGCVVCLFRAYARGAQSYYFNKITGETSWTVPDGFVAGGGGGLPAGWRSITDEEGDVRGAHARAGSFASARTWLVCVRGCQGV